MYPFPPPCLFGCTACLASCRSCVSLANQCGVAALHDHRQAVVRHESVRYYCRRLVRRLRIGTAGIPYRIGGGIHGVCLPIEQFGVDSAYRDNARRTPNGPERCSLCRHSGLLDKVLLAMCLVDATTHRGWANVSQRPPGQLPRLALVGLQCNPSCLVLIHPQPTTVTGKIRYRYTAAKFLVRRGIPSAIRSRLAHIIFTSPVATPNRIRQSTGAELCIGLRRRLHTKAARDPVPGRLTSFASRFLILFDPTPTTGGRVWPLFTSIKYRRHT